MFFYFHQIEDLWNALLNAWPSLFGPDYTLWSNQWKKHGLCSYPTFDIHQYFSVALYNWGSRNLTDDLGRYGIRPLAYTLEAIEKSVGFTPQLICSNETTFWTSELLEIRLCHERNGIDLKNCTRQHGCPSNFYWLP
ncbi:putative ribonuclease T(2) [Medicago truncatula]|uniref:Putative ribonuclease T(2) n=1 Tax=Medicago truncatula TaxID=3880 RepID=A0A396HVM9_MEDTR|nr:putative ribonuclease T(2) [Medicago truncatula]